MREDGSADGWDQTATIRPTRPSVPKGCSTPIGGPKRHKLFKDVMLFKHVKGVDGSVGPREGHADRAATWQGTSPFRRSRTLGTCAIRRARVDYGQRPAHARG